MFLDFVSVVSVCFLAGDRCSHFMVRICDFPGALLP